MKILFLFLFTISTLARVITLSNGESAKLSYEKEPEIYKLESMSLFLNTPVEGLKVRLFHPGINHFSSNPEIKSLDTASGRYDIKNVFFIHDGLWELQLLNSENTLLGKYIFQIKKYIPNQVVTTHAIFKGQTYKGVEFYNGENTGAICYVVIDNVVSNKKGKHCYDIDWRYASTRLDVPKAGLLVSSRITNYHRREYPRIKTCAMNTNGYTSGDDIYEDDTSILVNDIFNGLIKNGKTEYHHFLSIAKSDKKLYQARVHGLRWDKEWDVDCRDLKEIK